MYIDFAEFVSLCLTAPTILLAWLVVWNYWPRAKAAIQTMRRGEHTTEVDLLVVGIAAAFIGGMLDNIYWGITWTTEFLGHPSRDAWFAHGAMSNIPFRQLTGIGAAILHLWPVVVGRKRRNRYITWVAVATLITSVALISERFLSG